MRNAYPTCLLGILFLMFPLSLASAGEPLAFPPTLPDTEPLTIEQPLDEVMVDGINRFALRELAASPDRRAEKWNRDYRSPAAYENSIAENRQRFRTIIGAVDPRIEPPAIEAYSALIGPGNESPTVARNDQFTVHSVRWQVLEGITAEGLLLQPTGDPQARVVALPDADWTPEMFAGLAEGVTPQAQLARRLAENGCQVVVPLLINRDDTHSGHPDVAYTNQTHREFIYRMAFEMGRHIIGYEVQKVLAAVDAFELQNNAADSPLPIGVAGVGEGGLLAFYSAALDPRIDAALVCGYFQRRENVWQEPIYRNVWSLLREFGDAEIAGLIAPRPLVIEACAVPGVAGPPEARQGRRETAAPGTIETATLASVRLEYDRARQHYDKLQVPQRLSFVSSREGDFPAGTDAALTRFLSGLGLDQTLVPSGDAPQITDTLPDADRRRHRQFTELVEFTQRLMHRSDKVRDRFWSEVDRSSIEAWQESAEFYRNYVWEEMIGKLPEPEIPLNVRTRKVFDESTYQGYEVVLDVYPDVIAAGILLLPGDLQPGEKRPVVVCQHGLEGTPMSTISTEARPFRAYKAYSVQLVERGFIVYAPQNPYRGYHNFRSIQRKSNPLKRSLFSYIIPQHQRTLEWLSSLPYVDPQRIGFYGLSYGGKTAVRVPPFLPQYALSICSADFNEWIRKNVSNEDRYSYIFTIEYEIFEWNMGHVANYAELSYLMTPRPFMVERGHHDGVAPDEWVAWEYAKVRRHYTQLGLADKTEIEFFDGPHAIYGVGTFDFLHRHLDWPAPASE